MRRYASGVVVLTVTSDSEVRGMTAVSFNSVSLEPPLVSMAVARTARTHGILKKGQNFAINILGCNQRQLAERFATSELSGQEQFEPIDYHEGPLGLPILEGCLGNLECRLHVQFEVGDHTIFIGQVERAEIGEHGLPLIFFEGNYGTLVQAVGFQNR